VRFAGRTGGVCRDRGETPAKQEQAEALGRAGRTYVETNYGWDVIVPRLEALYR